MVRAIQPWVQVVVNHPHPLNAQDLECLRVLDPPLEVLALERASFPEYFARTEDLCRSGGVDACLFERLEMGGLRPAVPEGVLAILDTHDLLSSHQESRSRAGVSTEGGFSLSKELALLDAFDLVLMIQQEEYGRVAEALGDKALLVPHPSLGPCQVPRATLSTLGFMGSDYEANPDGLGWFLQEVWPRLEGHGLGMHLWGTVGSRLGRPLPEGWTDHGFVADPEQAWGAMDAFVNPVRWGSGLKIKSAEALGRGLPLVSTSCGVSGLPAHGEAFLVADGAAEFAGAVLRLKEDAALRRRLSEAGRRLAARLLSPRACFGPLFDRLGLPKEHLTG